MKTQRHVLFSRSLALLIFALSLVLPMAIYAQSNQVQVVLFYSPFCGHCQRVIGEDLPPIVQAYNTNFSWSYYGDPPNEETGQLPAIVAFEGNVLQILYVDTTTEIGGKLYMANVDLFQIPPDDQVVPIMVVGDQLLTGGVDIPEQLPGLVDSWLAKGGLSWPAIPGLEEVIASLVPLPDQAQETPTPESGEAATAPVVPDPIAQNPGFKLDVSKLGVLDRIRLDPIGNSLSIVVLIGMVFSLAAVGLRWRLSAPLSGGDSLPTAVLVLTILGIAVAGYLSYVGTSGAEAVCGPVGDCHTVQASRYAYTFGIIPNGLLGLAAYLGMLAAWLLARQIPRYADHAILAVFGLAFIGTAFSTYLTFLEPFVIGATCLWCLSSAVIITAILLLSLNPARAAYARWRS